MPGKLLTYITVRPSAAPLDAQPPNPYLWRLSLSGDTPYHEIGRNVEQSTGGDTFHGASGCQLTPSV